jgi:rod shape-determining protein MreC
VLIPSLQERKTWLGVLVLFMVGLNLYFNYSYKQGLENRARWIDHFFVQSLSPVQYGVALGKRSLASTIGFFGEVWVARSQNQELRTEVAELSIELQQLEETRFENERLRKLLDFQERQPMDYIVARVIAKDPSAFSKTLVIDRGRQAGVEVGMPVVSAEGVVGTVHQVGLLSSRILLINDVNARLDAVVQRSRARTILAGDIGGSLKLRYLPRRQDIEVGDLLVTSGLGGHFPPGFRVGWISELNKNPNVVLEEAQVRPAVNFDSVEEVFIVKALRSREWEQDAELKVD